MESIGSELEERLLLAFSLRELEIELRATRSYAIPPPSGIARPWNIREPSRLLAAEWNEGETHPFQTILLSRDNNDFLAASHAIACESEKKNACMEQRVCIEWSWTQTRTSRARSITPVRVDYFIDPRVLVNRASAKQGNGWNGSNYSRNLSPLMPLYYFSDYSMLKKLSSALFI